jgi:hypothetical protein
MRWQHYLIMAGVFFLGVVFAGMVRNFVPFLPQY